MSLTSSDFRFCSPPAPLYHFLKLGVARGREHSTVAQIGIADT